MILGFFLCVSAIVVDGDTLRCANVPGEGRVRLAAIDTPEMRKCPKRRTCAPGDPHAAKLALYVFTVDEEVRCEQTDASPFKKGFQEADHYGRPVARCRVRLANGEIDLSDELLRLQLARPWP